jgi:hypothetical protein
MTEAEVFVMHARELLRRPAPVVTGEILAAHREDHARLAAASLPMLIALDAACPLDSDADFELAGAIHRALDTRSIDDWERALVEAYPPPEELDISVGEPWEIKVVVHPEHGVGLLEIDWLPRGQCARVRFRDGERTFDNARWSHPTRVFTREAGLALIPKVESSAEDEFWQIVEAIDWGSGRPIDALAATLANRVSYIDCIALHGRSTELAHHLEQRIERWEETADEKLPCGDDSFGDLVKHIIGLGRATYVATMENPALAMARAEARDYRECFNYVFQLAEELYPISEIQAALRALAPQALVEDPLLGVGLYIRANQIAFATRTVIRTSP